MCISTRAFVSYLPENLRRVGARPINCVPPNKQKMVPCVIHSIDSIRLIRFIRSDTDTMVRRKEMIDGKNIIKQSSSQAAGGIYYRCIVVSLYSMYYVGIPS